MSHTEFDRVYRKNYDTVFRYIIKGDQKHDFFGIKDPDIAEQITQDAFATAWEKWDKFRGDCQISTWICAIARYCALDHLKKTKRRPPFEDIDYEKADEEDHLQDHQDPESIHIAIEECDALSKREKTALQYRLQGRGYDDIGGMMGIKSSTARTYIERGSKKLDKEPM